MTRWSRARSAATSPQSRAEPGWPCNSTTAGPAPRTSATRSRLRLTRQKCREGGRPTRSSRRARSGRLEREEPRQSLQANRCRSGPVRHPARRWGPDLSRALLAGDRTGLVVIQVDGVVAGVDEVAGHGFEVAQQLRLLERPEADLFHGGRHVLPARHRARGRRSGTLRAWRGGGDCPAAPRTCGPAPELGEEQAEPLPGTVEIVRVEGTEHFVRRHPGVEPLA